ncbi:MAG: hypothetical protein JWO52_3066 [Gammaproteobacteria bacterium]|nr:hypothetical protein [Gammaproteobacteria bacterium]
MSPILEIITDFFASAVGGVVGRRRKHPPFPEGAGNASLGALASFAGVLAFVFALALLLNAAYARDFTGNDYVSVIGASVAVALLALGGRWAGVRAPRVTRRNLGPARLGRGAAMLALGMSLVAALLAAIGLIHRRCNWPDSPTALAAGSNPVPSVSRLSRSSSGAARRRVWRGAGGGGCEGVWSGACARSPRDTQASVFSGSVAPRSGIPSDIGAHFRAQANFSVRSSFFTAASALSASDLLAKACAPSTRTGGLECVNFAPLPLL